MTLPALTDSLPPPPVRDLMRPADICCTLAAGCGWSGPWAAYLEHAPCHTLPHPTDRAAWLASRRTFLGASEISAVVGQNPYQGPLEVWSAKVAPRPELPFTPRPIAGGGRVVRPSSEMGNLIEGPLLADFARRHGCTIVSPATARHPSIPWLAATPDGVATGGDCDGALVQVKKVGHRVDWVGDWDNGPPVYTLLQVQCEMLVWERDRCIVLADLGELCEYPVDFDADLIGPAVEIAADFWRCVERCEVPIDFDLRNTRTETLRHLWPEASGPAIAASEEFIRVARSYAEAREREKIGKEDKEALGVQLAAMLGPSPAAQWGKSRVTWQERGRPIDWKSYALALGGNETEAEKHRPKAERTLDVRLK